MQGRISRQLQGDGDSRWPGVLAPKPSGLVVSSLFLSSSRTLFPGSRQRLHQSYLTGREESHRRVPNYRRILFPADNEIDMPKKNPPKPRSKNKTLEPILSKDIRETNRFGARAFPYGKQCGPLMLIGEEKHGDESLAGEHNTVPTKLIQQDLALESDPIYHSILVQRYLQEGSCQLHPSLKNKTDRW